MKTDHDAYLKYYVKFYGHPPPPRIKDYGRDYRPEIQELRRKIKLRDKEVVG